jgi:Methylamine utilisation protein MauE
MMALAYIAQSAFAAMLLIALVLLAAAGIAKAWRPQSAMDALRTAGIKPASRVLVYCIAGVELGACAAVLTIESPVPAMAVGALYIGFGAFVASLLLRGRHSVSCGCFGAEEMPVHWLHVVLDGVLAAGCLLTAVTVGTEPASAVSASEATTLALAAGFGGYLSYAAMTLAPRVEESFGRATPATGSAFARSAQFKVHNVNGGNVERERA